MKIDTDDPWTLKCDGTCQTLAKRCAQRVSRLFTENLMTDDAIPSEDASDSGDACFARTKMGISER